MDLSAHDRFPARPHHHFATEKLSALVANQIALVAIGVAVIGSLVPCRGSESDIDRRTRLQIRHKGNACLQNARPSRLPPGRGLPPIEILFNTSENHKLPPKPFSK